MNTTRLARMKAPAGGAIVNNQFQPGGQFLQTAFRKVRDVAARLKARASQPTRLARLQPGRPAKTMSGETKYVHDFHDESGKPLGTISLVPRGDALHVDWVGLHGAAAGESAGRAGVSHVRSLIPQIADAYPDAKVLVGQRAGGAFKGQYRGVPLRMSRPEEYARLVGAIEGNKQESTLHGAFADHLEENGVPGAHVAREHAENLRTGVRTLFPRRHPRLATPVRVSPLLPLGPTDPKLQEGVINDYPDFTPEQRQHPIGQVQIGYGLRPGEKRVLLGVGHRKGVEGETLRSGMIVHLVNLTSREHLEQLMADFPEWAKKYVRRFTGRFLPRKAPEKLARKKADPDTAAAEYAEKVRTGAETAPGIYSFLDAHSIPAARGARSLTKRELRTLEAAFDIPKALRLSTLPSVQSLGDHQHLSDAGDIRVGQALAFVNAMAARHLDVAGVRKIVQNPKLTDNVRAALTAAISAHETRRFAEAKGEGGKPPPSAEWYKKGMNPLDVVFHTLHARSTHDPIWGSVDWAHPEGPRLRYEGRPVWEHAPGVTALRAVIGMTSAQRNPVENADIAERLIRDAVEQARAKGHHDWVSELRTHQHGPLDDWLARRRADAARTPGLPAEPRDLDPKIRADDWDALVKWARTVPTNRKGRKTIGYRATKVFVSGDKAVAIPRVGGGQPVFLGKTPEERAANEALYNAELQKSADDHTAAVRAAKAKGKRPPAKPKGVPVVAGVPFVSPEGHLQPRAYTTAQGALSLNIRKLQAIHRHVSKGIPANEPDRDVKVMRALSKWVVTFHPRAEIEKVIGRELPEGGGYYKDEPELPGSFAFGPKMGAFIMNTHGNTPAPHGEDPDYYLRELTDDVWHSRGRQLHTGTLRVVGDKTKGDQPRPSERSPRLDAAQRVVAAEPPGSPVTDVASWQALDWDAQQHTPILFGVPVESYSFVHGANRLLRKYSDSGLPLAGMRGKHRALGFNPDGTITWVKRNPRTEEKEEQPMFPSARKAGLGARAEMSEAPERLARGDGGLGHALVYVSPSQREGSTYEQAVRGLHSPEMQGLVDHASRLPGVTGGQSGYGFWADGAEEARVVHTAPETADVVGASLAKRHRQKSFLAFTPGEGGPDALHVVTVPDNDPARVAEGLQRHGVEYKTIVPGPQPGTLDVHVVDIGGETESPVRAWAASANAVRHQRHPGKSEYVGRDDRDEAARVFDGILSGRVTSEG